MLEKGSGKTLHQKTSDNIASKKELEYTNSMYTVLTCKDSG